MTKNQEAYIKEIRRLQDGLRKAIKRGYLPDLNLVPTLPTRVTQKRLAEIRKLKPRDIYIKGKWFDKETGEIITAKQHIYKKPNKDKSKREVKADNAKGDQNNTPINVRKPEQTLDNTSDKPQSYNGHVSNKLENLYLDIQSLHGHIRNYLIIWYDNLINNFDIEDIDKVFDTFTDDLLGYIRESNLPSEQAIYDYVNHFMDKLSTILGSKGKQWVSDFMDSVEEQYQVFY